MTAVVKGDNHWSWLSLTTLGDGCSWFKVPKVVLILMATLRHKLTPFVEREVLGCLRDCQFFCQAQVAPFAFVAVGHCSAVYRPLNAACLPFILFGPDVLR